MQCSHLLICLFNTFFATNIYCAPKMSQILQEFVIEGGSSFMNRNAKGLSGLQIDLLSVIVDLPFLPVSYRWTPTLHGLVCLTTFTQQDISRVHPHGSMFQHLISSLDECYSIVWMQDSVSANSPTG